MNPMAIRRSARVLLLVCLTMSYPVRGAHADPGRVEQVLILVPQASSSEQMSRYEVLRVAMEAHLSSHLLVVRFVPHEGDDPEMCAQELARDEEPLTVAWLVEDGDRLGILTPGLSAEAHARAIPDDGEGWAARCEMMAAMAASELASLMRSRSWAARGDTEAPQSDRSEDEALAPSRDGLGDDAVASRPPTRVPVHVLISMNYLPVKLSADGPAQHGLGLGAAIRLGPHLELGAGLDLIQHVPLEHPDGPASLGRYPVRLAGVGLLPVGPLDLGLVLGLTLEVSKLGVLPVEPRDQDADRVHTSVGFSPALRVRVAPLPPLAVYADLGGDFFFGSNTYRYGTQILFERSPSVLRLIVGVSGVISVPPRIQNKEGR